LIWGAKDAILLSQEPIDSWPARISRIACQVKVAGALRNAQKLTAIILVII
jgi:hypothetical protein